MFRPDLRSIVCLLILTMRPVVVEAAPDKGDAGKANTHTWSMMDFGWLPDPGQKIVRPHVTIEPDGRNGFQLKLISRSEEHTSELQSHLNLVCRLLLEKKKNHHL